MDRTRAQDLDKTLVHVSSRNAEQVQVDRRFETNHEASNGRRRVVSFGAVGSFEH